VVAEEAEEAIAEAAVVVGTAATAIDC